MINRLRRALQSIAWYAVAIALACAALGGAAQAQCVGDCDGSNTVSVSELVTGVNISLGSRELTACPSFDRDQSGDVGVAELVTGVNNSLQGCPGGPTATATPIQSGATATATATTAGPTSTVTATPTMSTAVCGNNVVENFAGETCDDGNTEDGDSCPSDCRIDTCPLFGGTVTGDITFTTDSQDLLILGLSLFLKYRDGVVDVPGNGPNDPVTVDNVTSDVFSVTPNDRDYGINLVLTDPFLIGVPGDSVAATLNFALCEGASPPPPDTFDCMLINATDTSGTDVTDHVGCTFALR